MSQHSTHSTIAFLNSRFVAIPLLSFDKAFGQVCVGMEKRDKIEL